ncbi:unnamed protein product, partial [Medioppia subpectinata]
QHFNFGPSLNLIAAPNGSGKSSIANSLAFVFNGTTKTVGKSKSIADFIRSGTTKAEIECVIYKENKLSHVLDATEESLGKKQRFSRFCGPNYIHLKRIITPDQKSQSSYFIDGKPVDQKSYLDFVASCKIDCNNLTNFLPQERVSEFTQMTGVELFNEVYRNMIIDHSDSQDGLMDPKKLNHLIDELEKLQEAIEIKSIEIQSKSKQQNIIDSAILTLQSEMEKFKKFEENEKQIRLLRFKKSRISYEEAKARYLGYKNAIQVSTEKQKINSKEIVELENVISELEKEPNLQRYKSGERILLAQNSKIEDICRQIKNFTMEIEVKLSEKAKVEKKNQVIRKENENLKKQQAENSVQKKEIEAQVLNTCMEILSNLKNPNSYGDLIPMESFSCLAEISKLEDKVKKLFDGPALRNLNIIVAEIEAVIPSTRPVMAIIHSFDDENRKIQQKSKDLQYKIQDLERQKQVYSHEKNKRMEMLRKFHLDTYKAVQYLRENDMGIEFLEPSFLHLNIHKDYSDEIENILGFQVLSSFIVFDQQDLLKLAHKLKDELKLSINFIQIKRNAVDYYIPNDLPGQLNFDGYAIDFIIASKEYKQMFCTYAFLHTIPVSKREVNEEEIFKKVTNCQKIVANGRMIQVIKNIYNSECIHNAYILKKRGLFQLSVDLNNIDNTLNQFNVDRKNAKIQLEELLGKRQKYDDAMKSMISTNITKLEQDLLQLLSIEDIPTVDIDKMREAKLEYENALRQIGVKRMQKRDTDDELSSLKNQKEIYKATAGDLSKELESMQQAEHERKRLHENTQTFTFDKKTRNDLSKNFYDEISDLPNDLIDISSQINSLTSQNMLLDSKGQIRSEFKRKEFEFNKVKSTKLITAHIYKYLTPVNDRFKSLFEKFGFQGEVKLCFASKDDGEDGETNMDEGSAKDLDSKFEKSLAKSIEEYRSGSFALSIYVKFREKEMMQKLSSTRHSGGEKSVSTVLFLLSLQSSSTPFRLVDEINQGMDQHNERKVFEVLKDMASSSQFFIITPKLIENLEFSDQTRAIVLYSSQGIKQLEEYANSKLINN